ncbi:MAG: MFS transporter [Spirochaetaceae bacterium]|jgi:MFS family permease|nr:MFS transporter [Spirochaetaceae bacterium]
MAGTLSPYHLGKAREWYNLFSVFNSLSWSFLAGNIIILFAMRLNASSTIIGILSALLYGAYFFLPLGKLIARKCSIVAIFSITWICRSLAMITLAAVPFVDSPELAMNLIILGVSLFHVIRGVGMIGNNPVLSNLASGPDRGSYMTQIQIINSAVAMFCGFFIALVLGRDPPLYLYALIMAAGIICGVLSGFLMRKIPEPPVEDTGKKAGFFTAAKEAAASRPLRRFIIIFFLMALVSAVSRSFIIVYSREVFAQSDGMVSLYSVFGGLGVLLIGLLSKFLVDRIGAKPIFIVCVIIGLAGMMPVILIPERLAETGSSGVLFLSFLFFIINFGFLGAEGIAQTYFLALVPMELMLDMGILYFFVFGVAGAGGSFLAGLFLDALSGSGLSVFTAFQILFGILSGITALALALQRQLVPLGALPFRGALEVMFSLRDLRAITLLEKLNKSKDSIEEEALLNALHGTPSQLALKGLLARARSPRLAVRMESLRAIEALAALDAGAEQALMADMVRNPFTTAYISARILGNHQVFAATPILRELALSEDYMLAGEAVIALAKLGDQEFRPHIEEIIRKTCNPRLKIMGVEAFGIYKSLHSLSVLLDILRVPDPPPYLSDEVVLAMADILDIQSGFYPLLTRFLEDESLAPTLAADQAEAAFEYYRNTSKGLFYKKQRDFAARDEQARSLLPAVAAFARDSDGGALSRWIWRLPEGAANPVTQTVMAEAALDDELTAYNRLRLLIVHWSSCTLRLLTKPARAGSRQNGGT